VKKAMIWMTLVVLASFAADAARATDQEPDILLLDGERVEVNTSPLRRLVQQGALRLPTPDALSSSNGRGYVATWEIRDGRLLLTRLTILLKPQRAPPATEAVATDVLSSVFGTASAVHAEWYSGALVIPHAGLQGHARSPHAPHARYTVLGIERGHVVSRANLDAAQFDALRTGRASESSFEAKGDECIRPPAFL
jgi:hypothetical protein